MAREVTVTKNLDEISLIRPILILFLILYHCFIIFDGGWELPDGAKMVRGYNWISRFSYSGMLESFVFISGYVYSFQVNYLKRDNGFITLAKNKFLRLYVPSMIFSALYLCLIDNWGDSIFQSITHILNSSGHLWFLPMLFWCFIACWIIERIPIGRIYKLIMLLPIMLLAKLHIPLGVDSMMLYIFYFYAGYICMLHRDYFIEHASVRHILLIFALYLPLFIYLSSQTFNNEVIAIYSKVLYSVLAVSLYFTSAIVITKSHPTPSFINNFGKYCFGAYLIQQFIIVYIYSYTSIPRVLNSIILPWVVFIFATIISFTLSYLLTKFKLGRVCLGMKVCIN